MKKQVIHYANIPVGILVPEDAGFRFIAVKFHVYQLNDRHFKSAAAVHQAIHDLLAEETPSAWAA